ncbi:MAG TPA: Gfo/Idh/MocA family oxidoreductase [Chloroflexota bacterium]|jgi:predicted dehydrogenase
MAAKKYRVGVIGVAHMHVNELMRKFAEHPQAELVAIADTKPEVPEINTTSRSTRGYTLETARDELGIPKQYEDYRQLLDRERLDIAIVCSENARHGEVCEAALAHRAHVVTEKPMAASLAEALTMVRAARAADRRLMVNWPSTWSPAIRRMKALLDDGAIGRLWEVHARYGSLGPLSYGSTHPGVKGPTAMLTDEEKAATWWHRAGNGGGALLDYCCYGACLSRWYFGVPAQAVFGLKMNANTHYGSADDNAVLTVRFPQGLAVLRATWSVVDHAIPTGPILYGTTGTMSLEGASATGQVRLVQDKGEQPRIIEGSPLPEGRDTLAREFIHHLETGEPLHPTLDPDFNLDAMAVLDAGIRSAESGQMELVNSAYWTVG